MDTARQISGAGERAASPAPHRLDPELLDRLATALADQFAVLYDARPVDPRATLTGELLAFNFRGGLTPSDEWLLKAGRDEQLRDFREHFLRAVGDELGTVVEALSGAEVERFVPAFDPATRTTDCFFTLAARAEDEAEQRQALLNWSEQVRRNARQQHERHRLAREAHVRLREAVKEARLELHDE